MWTREAELGVGSVPTRSVGPGRPKLHLGSVCPDDGKSFRSTFLGKRNLSSKFLRIIVQQAFPGTYREVPVTWTGTTGRVAWTAQKAMRLSSGGIRDPSCRLREKRKCSHKSSHTSWPGEGRERSRWEGHSCDAGSTTVDTPQACSSSVTPWDARNSIPSTAVSHFSLHLVDLFACLFLAMPVCIAMWAFPLAVVGILAAAASLVEHKL